MSAVGVLGGGRWGVALACAARRSGAEVLLHSRREVEPEALKNANPLGIERLVDGVQTRDSLV